MNSGVATKIIAQEVQNRGIKQYELVHEVFSNVDHIEVKNNELLFIHYMNMNGTEDQIVKIESANQYLIKNKNNMRVFFITADAIEPEFYLESSMVSIHQGFTKLSAKFTNNFFLLAIRLKVLDHEKSKELHSA